MTCKKHHYEVIIELGTIPMKMGQKSHFKCNRVFCKTCKKEFHLYNTLQIISEEEYTKILNNKKRKQKLQKIYEQF